MAPYCKTFGANSAFMDAVNSCEALVSTYHDDALLSSHRYENIVLSSLEFAIGTEEISDMIR